MFCRLLIAILLLYSQLHANFPKDFLWGTAIAEFQNSGSQQLPNCNWAHFEKRSPSPIAEGHTSGHSVDHWNKYQQDIALMKKTKLNTFRLSIDWSAIEPEEGIVNQAALDHYHHVLDALNAANIKPMVTLHHFTHPQWFDEKGGFERVENIQYFLNFCKTVFAQYNTKVPLWCTINEPAVYAFTGYILGIHAPGKSIRTEAGFTTSATVLKNLLQAHVTVYKELKKMNGGEKAQIGIVHNALKFIPLYWWEPVEKSLSTLFTHFTNDLVMEFLATGIFNHSFCGLGGVTYIDTDAPDCNDFIGLNYYARSIIGFNSENFFGPTCFNGQVMGDMHLPIDPEGFAEAIYEIAALGKPIYITENGMADEHDNRRPDMLKQYFKVIETALERGVDIRGYYLWTLVDNFEWHEGRTKKFGIFDENRVPKESAEFYRKFIEEAADKATSKTVN